MSHKRCNTDGGMQVGGKTQGQRRCLLREEEGSQEAVNTSTEGRNGGREDKEATCRVRVLDKPGSCPGRVAATKGGKQTSERFGARVVIPSTFL